MRYCRFDDNNAIVQREIDDIDSLVSVMIHADYHDWLEGLGMPTCHRDIIIWREMGKFLQKVKQCQPPSNSIPPKPSE